MKLHLIIIFVLLTGCSLYHGTAGDWYEAKDRQDVGSLSGKDFVDHLNGIAEDFIKSKTSKKLKMTSGNNRYLRRIYNKIVDSNEMILKNRIKAKFYIVDKKQPFCFSLPGGYFFLSARLIVDYVKHEELLVAALTHEIIRSQLNIYKKKMIIPTGDVEIEKLISLTRINLTLKMKVNKWSYHAMKRAGYDGFGYMLWVQIQNKNALDFIFQLGDLHSISKEEYLFKSFIAEEMKKENYQTDRKMHSSTGFYHLRSNIQKQYYEG